MLNYLIQRSLLNFIIPMHMLFSKVTFEITGNVSLELKKLFSGIRNLTLLICHHISTILGNVHITVWESQECCFRSAC